MIKLNTLRVVQLNTLLRANDLPTTGAKAIKIEKLQEVLGTDEVDPMELEDDSAVSSNDLRTQLNSLKEAMAGLTLAIGTMNRNPEVIPRNEANQQTINNNDGRPSSSVASWESAEELRTPSGPTMRIQDMIGVMPEFDPIKGTTTSRQFISRTQQLQQCYGWREEMILIAVQHKMKGMAKQWLDAQNVFSSWSQFVHAFETDFPSTQNAAETHKTLMKRKRKPNENYLEYYYAMLTIGRQGGVDDVSINMHIIGGLNDSILTKTLATMNFATCSQLLVALKNLTTVSNVSVSPATETQQTLRAEEKPKPNLTQIKCFNCNDYGHIAAKCQRPQRKPRCTICKKTDHEAKNCNKKTSVAKIGDETDRDGAPPITKIVELNGRQLNAFIDTGSVCSLIRASAVGDIQTTGTRRCFTGFGGSKVQVAKQINVQITVDNVPREAILYMVADEMLPYDVLLGRDVLQQDGYRMVIGNGVLRLEEDRRTEFNISSCLSEEDKNKTENLLLTFKQCFAESISQIGRCKNAQMTISVTTSEPILGKRYQVPFSQRPILSEILKELLDNDIIRPSDSPHAASVLLVKKSNGESRMCIDFRALNEVMVKKNYVMPIVEEQLSRLAGNKYFTTLDMTSGYYQVPMNEESEKYTAFLTHEGLFEHNVMPFGLVNAPMVFQEIVVNLIKTLKHRDKVVSYVDGHHSHEVR
ncbi:uncharacterized protein K02A2.6-like [Anastrepha ludens]|uniref:uncharacterized protein K02A2.6-like n=1 Tax=Anastrepha ludens TaxID=28586 RepID=UPI0023B10C20|nr:uncharacterized protein K02A2.6-like [Anastrepha ludens]